MLNTWFKGLELIQDYVGLEVAIQIAMEYDHEVLIPLLLIIYNNLMPTPFIANLGCVPIANIMSRWVLLRWKSLSIMMQ
jgi:hypothetical protein